MRPVKLFFAIQLLFLLTGCVSGYKQFYSPSQGATPERVASSRLNPPPQTPLIERMPPIDGALVLDMYAKRGYVPIGHSFFNSGKDESEASALTQGKEVGADLVLVLNPKYTGTVTTTVPITTPTTSTSYSSGMATAYGPNGPVTAYGTGTTTTYGTTTNYVPITVNRMDFGAIYFIKQRFKFGAFTRDLNDKERQDLQTNKGAVVRVIADGSPAFNADILSGDILVSIDDSQILTGESFTQIVNDKKGKLVQVRIIRNGKIIEKSIQLNP